MRAGVSRLSGQSRKLLQFTHSASESSRPSMVDGRQKLLSHFSSSSFDSCHGKKDTRKFGVSLPCSVRPDVKFSCVFFPVTGIKGRGTEVDRKSTRLNSSHT